MLKRVLLALTFVAALGAAGVGMTSKAEAHGGGYFYPHRGHVVAHPAYYAPPPVVVYHRGHFAPGPRWGHSRGFHHFGRHHHHHHRHRGGLTFSIGF